MRTCKTCGEEKDIEQFPIRKRTPRAVYRKYDCSICDNRRIMKAHTKNPEKQRERNQRYRTKPANLAIVLLRDINKSDKKRGFSNDLDVDFLKSAIASSCTYCGENQLRVSLDRIDNLKGHMKSNVVPCCSRCNYMRRDMPYEAWIHISSAVKEAKEKGLFGKWDGFGRAKKLSHSLPCAVTQRTSERSAKP